MSMEVYEADRSGRDEAVGGRDDEEIEDDATGGDEKMTSTAA